MSVDTGRWEGAAHVTYHPHPHPSESAVHLSATVSQNKGNNRREGRETGVFSTSGLHGVTLGPAVNAGIDPMGGGCWAQTPTGSLPALHTCTLLGGWVEGWGVVRLNLFLKRGVVAGAGTETPKGVWS